MSETNTNSNSTDRIQCVDESYHRKVFESQHSEAKALFFDGPSVQLQSEFKRMRGALERLSDGRFTADQTSYILPWITTEVARELIHTDRKALLALLRESPNLSQLMGVLTGTKKIETTDISSLMFGSPKEAIVMMLLMSEGKPVGTLQILNEAFGTQIDRSTTMTLMGKKMTIEEVLEMWAQKAREHLEENLRKVRQSCERIEQKNDLKDVEELNGSLLQ